MTRLSVLALAAVAAVACRDSEIITPDGRGRALSPRAASADVMAGDERAAYISDFTTNSILVVGEVSHDTIAVIPLGDYPGSSASSPDGTRVYVVLGYVEKLAVIRTSDNTLLAKVPLGGSGSAGVVVSPDNRRIYVGNREGTVSVLDATTLQILYQIPVAGISPFMLDLTPDGTHLYVGDNADNRVAVVNTTTRTVETTVAVGYRPWSVDVTNDGQFVYVANRGGTVSKISTATNTVVATITLGGMPVGLSVTPDNQRVFVANPNNNNVVVISVATNQVVGTVSLVNAYYPQVTPDGRWVFVTRPGSGAVAVLDAQTLAVVASIPVTYPAAGISFAPYTPPSQPTTTAITSSADPSVTGQAVLFTATVTSGSTPVTVGAVTLRLGGTTCADAPVVLAGPLPLDASGQAAASHAFLAGSSPYAVRACYDGTTTAPRYDPSEGSVIQTVHPAPVGLVAAATPSTQQYSDQVVLSVQLALESGALQGETLTGLVTFSFGGVAVGTAAVNAATLPITVTLTAPHTLAVPAGSYAVSASFASANANFVSGTTTDGAVTVVAENAAVTPDAVFPAEARVTAPSGTSGPLTFAFTVREVSPELNSDPSLALAGDLTLTRARAVFTPSGGGAPITLACVGGSVTGTGYAQVRPFSCDTPGLAAEVYQVALEVIAAPGGSYYAGTHSTTFRVYDPSAETTDLMAEIAALIDAGTLDSGNGNALTSKLEAALASVARGNDNAAVSQIDAFIHQVEALVRSNQLAPGIGDQLINVARAIQAELAT